MTSPRSRKKHSRTFDALEGLPPSSRKPTKPSGKSIELWPEQEFAADFIVENDAVALFFEQRTGKTFITLAAIDRLPRENMAIVLVCLLNNKESTWGDGIAEYLPWLHVTRDWEEYKRLPFPKLLLVHFEELHLWAAKIKRVAWVTFAIIDEGHRLKARGTRLSRAAARLRGIPKRLLLTGTPIEKQPKDLWGQFRFVAEWVFGTWAEFENRFMDFKRIDMEGVKPGTARWQFKIMQQGMLRSRAKFREEKLPLLLKLIKPHALRLTKVDVGIVPPRAIKVTVALPEAQMRVYRDMKTHSVARLGGGARVLAPLAVTNIVKRRQIASGFVYDDDGICRDVGGHGKLDRLLRLFDRLSKPIVVFTTFDPEVPMIADALRAAGYRIATVTGKTKKSERPHLWRQFQRARYDGLVCHVKVGGAGVDMWKSGNAIAHSITHSSIDWKQMSSRLDVKGKTKAARIFVLCGENTIDEDLFDMVVEKGLTAEQVLSQLKKGAR